MHRSMHANEGCMMNFLNHYDTKGGLLWGLSPFLPDALGASPSRPCGIIHSMGVYKAFGAIAFFGLAMMIINQAGHLPPPARSILTGECLPLLAQSTESAVNWKRYATIYGFALRVPKAWSALECQQTGLTVFYAFPIDKNPMIDCDLPINSAYELSIHPVQTTGSPSREPEGPWPILHFCTDTIEFWRYIERGGQSNNQLFDEADVRLRRTGKSFQFDLAGADAAAVLTSLAPN